MQPAQLKRSKLEDKTGIQEKETLIEEMRWTFRFLSLVDLTVRIRNGQRPFILLSVFACSLQRANELSRSNGHQSLHPLSTSLLEAIGLVTRLYEDYNLYIPVYGNLLILLPAEADEFTLSSISTSTPPLLRWDAGPSQDSPTLPPPNVLQVATTT